MHFPTYVKQSVNEPLKHNKEEELKLQLKH